MRHDLLGDLHISRAETLARLSSTRLFDRVFQHDDEIVVEMYVPRGRDRQVPHDREELYIVISGSGRFQRGDEMVDFAPGDLLYVPAFMKHRFETFSDDLATWVIFFGPTQHR